MAEEASSRPGSRGQHASAARHRDFHLGPKVRTGSLLIPVGNVSLIYCFSFLFTLGLVVEDRYLVYCNFLHCNFCGV